MDPSAILSLLISLDIQDIDIKYGLFLHGESSIWIKEKGRRSRTMVLPHCLCKIIDNYLKRHPYKKGPLLLSKRKKRISQRTLQDIFRAAADQLGIDKKLHARLFRHTAATHLNKVAGTDITQHVIGHSHRVNTLKYAHLNPDKYAVYMCKLLPVKRVALFYARSAKRKKHDSALNLSFLSPCEARRFEENNKHPFMRADSANALATTARKEAS